ncbi:DUF4145 domain-containing protein [Sulfurovum sp. NBC37-1]|uniref:DUF4145 domain-containing protein n=1 Tax=Sulfurovum sp. (strain NBC37-1) TaxID=387093 RepID=UPI000158794B|nr:DUF4145 domain-containing protein [Sulfurovum sp. NBC37-1]BAF72366.1 conserved hypothetical protein [Sulfurovum sp. NBC37-1]
MHEPSTKETAFDCPHCGAYTTQYWHNTYVKFIRGESGTPVIPSPDFEDKIKEIADIDKEQKQKLIEHFRRIRSKVLFTDETTDYGDKPQLHNLFVSQCYNCKKWAVWVNEDIIYPPKKFGVQPNQDLPEAILSVVEEARSILDASPKGAAALLRLAIQMLCKHLGESGENLNEDIAALVSAGLNPIVQKSLDVVRVIGNESVHPGSIDLNDDKNTAVRLFDLVNIIADQMITQPKHVEELYEKLPESKRKAIDRRDRKGT